jgi:hypothetical protein
MKYVITESQYNLLVETNPISIKRRFNFETMRKHVFDAGFTFPNPCDDFINEFDYADNVISKALDNFLTVDESFWVFLSDNIENIYPSLFDKTKYWFGEHLFEMYRNTCKPYMN